MKSPRDLVSELAMRRERRIEIIAGVFFSAFSVLILIFAAVCAGRLHEVVATEGMALANVANPDLYLGGLQAGGGYALWGIVLGFQAMQHFARAAQANKIRALCCLLQELEYIGRHHAGCVSIERCSIENKDRGVKLPALAGLVQQGGGILHR